MRSLLTVFVSFALLGAHAAVSPVASAQETAPAGASPAAAGLNSGGAVGSHAVSAAPRYRYTLRVGATYLSDWSEPNVSQAQRVLADAQKGDCLIVDRAGKRYLVSDPDILWRLRENDDEQRKLRAKRSELQEEIDVVEAEKALITVRVHEATKKRKAAEQSTKPEDKRAVAGLRREEKAVADRAKSSEEKTRRQSDRLGTLWRRIQQDEKALEARWFRIIDTAFLKQLAMEQPAEAAKP